MFRPVDRFKWNAEEFVINIGFFRLVSFNTYDLQDCGRVWGSCQWQLNLPGGYVLQGNYPQRYDSLDQPL